MESRHWESFVTANRAREDSSIEKSDNEYGSIEFEGGETRESDER